MGGYAENKTIYGVLKPPSTVLLVFRPVSSVVDSKDAIVQGHVFWIPRKEADPGSQ